MISKTIRIFVTNDHVMKKAFLLMAVAAGMASAASCAKEAPKVLVLYYSQTDNTRTVAEEIASLLGADIEEIVATINFVCFLL